ncbi:unnamed protein product, partial [Rotaria socialis]
EILDLSSNERSVLMDNVQIDSTMDDTSEFGNNTQQQQQQIVFFSTAQSKVSDVVRIKHQDFLNGRELLKSLNRIQSNKIDQILRAHLPDMSSKTLIVNDQEQRDR